MSWIADNILYMLLGIGILFSFLWLSEFKTKLKMNTFACMIIAILSSAAGVVSVKIFAFLESGGDSGMSLFGGIFFMPVLFYLTAKLFKRDIAASFDIITICMIFTIMCARVNCWIKGCCVGLPIPGTEGLFWPTRQLEIIFYIILLIALGRLVGKPAYSGRIYPLYMMAYGAFRFIIEWFRESDDLIGFFHIAHVWALITFFIGASIYIKFSKDNEGKGQKKKEGKKK